MHVKRRKVWMLALVGTLLIGGLVWVGTSQNKVVLADLYAAEVPTEGTETFYGIPLAWSNAQQFARWYDEIELTAEETKVMDQALQPLRAPCCDDNPLAKCCCERGGLICNIVRTARGLGKYLVRAGYSAEQVTQAMDQWLRFIHGDYYVAKALVARGEDPLKYGLSRPENGSCYRGMCNVALKADGCGGMGPQVLVEPPQG